MDACRGQVDKPANAAPVTLGPKEGDIALDKKFYALSVPKVGRTVRKLAPPTRWDWRIANTQRAPSHPKGSTKSFT